MLEDLVPADAVERLGMIELAHIVAGDALEHLEVVLLDHSTRYPSALEKQSCETLRWTLVTSPSLPDPCLLTIIFLHGYPVFYLLLYDGAAMKKLFFRSIQDLISQFLYLLPFPRPRSTTKH